MASVRKKPIKQQQIGSRYHTADLSASLSQQLVDLYKQGRRAEAEGLARRLTERFPQHLLGWVILGALLKEQGRVAEALPAMQQRVRLLPNDAESHYNLGNTYRELGRLIEAETSYRRALALQPEYPQACNNLGSVLKELGRYEEAEACYCQVAALQPQVAQYTLHAHLLLPIIPDEVSTLLAWRQRYQNGIATLYEKSVPLEEPGLHLDSLSFQLAYHNQDDCPLMEAQCRLFRKLCPGLNIQSAHLADWQPPQRQGRRIRIGFLSQYLVGHTIGKLYQGFVSHLDRTRFEVIVIHAPRARQDHFSEALQGLADRTMTLPEPLAAQQQAVAAERLDVLFYPDIGMSSATYFLAYARLAPVQVVSWGHPDTTGLDSMDYFLSAASIEPEEADTYYTERLIRLNRLPGCYQPLFVPTQIPPRATFGLPEEGILYGCLQSLFKLHPDFDAVMAAIASGDRTGRIVLLEGTSPTWSELLRKRWERNCPILLERALFLPRMPQEQFMQMLAHMDLLLDPIHFGSGNTLYEGMVYGTPIVTWPGRFMRGRIVAGAYRQMGIEDAPIARSVEEYAPLALTLAASPKRRQAIRQASLQAADRLFADMQAVREFESFLEAAVVVAGEGKRLPTGWTPSGMGYAKS